MAAPRCCGRLGCFICPLIPHLLQDPLLPFIAPHRDWMELMQSRFEIKSAVLGLSAGNPFAEGRDVAVHRGEGGEQRGERCARAQPAQGRPNPHPKGTNGTTLRGNGPGAEHRCGMSPHLRNVTSKCRDLALYSPRSHRIPKQLTPLCPYFRVPARCCFPAESLML